MPTPKLIFGTEFLETCEPSIRKAYDYWNAKRAGRPMPARADLDPVDIPRLLPGITLVDVEREPFQLVYRLVGTREVEYRGEDPTGQDVATHFHGPSAENALVTYRAVIERREPVFRNDRLTSERGLSVREERLFLPLSADGQDVDMVLVYATRREESATSRGRGFRD